MKRKTNIYSVVFLILLLRTTVLAQTSNFGAMSVTPNTIISVTDDFTNNGTGNVINNGDWYAFQNMENNGSFIHTPVLNSGIVRLKGTTTQALFGNVPFMWNDVEVDNPSTGGVLLNGNLRVAGVMEFNEGVVYVNPASAWLLFEEMATHISTADGSHVDGVQRKLGDQLFRFPCGDNGAYRPAEISAPADPTNIFSAEYLMQNSDPTYPHASVSTNDIALISNTEFWEIEHVGGSEVIIGLSYEVGITPDYITNNLDMVHVVRWDVANQEWVDEGGIHDPAESMIYTLSQVDQYGVFTLALMDEDVNESELIIYNAVTPNGNGQNDFFLIEGIEEFQENTLIIVNRWGETVFEVNGYDNVDNVFKGVANKGLVNTKKELPDGTYYYVLNYKKNSGETIKKVGYLHLESN